MRNLRLIGFAVVSVVLVTSAQAQHLGSRQQWQPQTESDPRLQQPVQLEIIGRAAITGLPILSGKTGVSLGVAPEDLDTVGERKFTVIAQGCSLKAIMVQLEEALQECHWDVDWREGQLVYLLHRNSSADLTGMQQEKEIGDRGEAEQKEARAARLEAARAALKMTPEELAELEKTEPVLARAAREPHARAMMEGLFSLPADQFAQFLDTGNATFPYSQVPAAAQKAAGLVFERFAEEVQLDLPKLREGEYTAESAAQLKQSLEVVKGWREALPRVTVSVLDMGSDFGCGIWFGAWIGSGAETRGYREDIIPARYISTDEGSGSWMRILQGTDVPDHDTAWAIITTNEREGFRHAREKLEARRNAEWVVPTDPDLLRVVKLSQDLKGLDAIQQSLSQQTGLSVISDSFARRGPWISEEMAAGQPLWRMLYLLGDDEFQGKVIAWRKVGKCLVFHDLHWYSRAQQEVPEALVLAYQDKLKAQGQFTLDDLAAFAVALGDRPVGFDSLPDDLARAGLRSASNARLGLRFYASLSPEQLQAARREPGLPYSEMTIAQKQQVAEIARQQSPPVSPDELPRMGFRLLEKQRERKAGEKTFVTTIATFRFQFPDRAFDRTAILTSEAKAPRE